MSKFNSISSTATKNVAGGTSYSRDIKKEIAQVILTSMLNGKNNFYESEKDRLTRIEFLVKNNPNELPFIAKAMVYTRNTGNLRSVSHYLAVLLAESSYNKEFAPKGAFIKTVVRPDDMTEIFALWKTRHKKLMLPNSLRRAFKFSLETKFDEYQLKKYAGTSSAVKLKDIVKVARPNPNKRGDETLFRRVIEDELKHIQTAQTINASTSEADIRASEYIKLLKENKLPYMAMMKNLNKILTSEITEDNLTLLLDYITSKRAVLNSKLLPFRFYDAYKAVKNLNIDRITTNKVCKAIEVAFCHSSANLGFGENERLAILLDESGSMGGGDKSPFNIGLILTAALLAGSNKENVTVWFWSDRAREINHLQSPFAFIESSRTIGGGTDVYGAISGLIASKTRVDTMIILTDLQMYSVDRGNRTFNQILTQYKKELSPNVKVAFWNLAGYHGGTPISLNTQNVYEVCGFSDKLLEVTANMLKYGDSDYLIKQIEETII